ALVNEAYRCVSMPAIRMFERRYQFFEGRARQARWRRLFESIGHDAVNATHVGARVKIQVPGDFLWDAKRLDNLAVHVGDVQGAIRGIGHENRTKPGVPRSEELNLLLVSRPFGARGRAGVGDFLMVDNVLRGIGNESVSDVLARKSVATINGQAARRRKIARRAAASLNAI